MGGRKTRVRSAPTAVAVTQTKGQRGHHEKGSAISAPIVGALGKQAGLKAVKKDQLGKVLHLA